MRLYVDLPEESVRRIQDALGIRDEHLRVVIRKTVEEFARDQLAKLAVKYEEDSDPMGAKEDGD